MQLVPSRLPTGELAILIPNVDNRNETREQVSKEMNITGNIKKCKKCEEMNITGTAVLHIVA